jgi:CheY-like chemotaxis protein
MMEGYGKRVLVVEDDDDVRTLISVILRETRYNVYEACDGLEAIDALKKRRYDVLLTDYHMPKMDGLELLDLTRAMWPELPVILATSRRPTVYSNRPMPSSKSPLFGPSC